MGDSEYFCSLRTVSLLHHTEMVSNTHTLCRLLAISSVTPYTVPYYTEERYCLNMQLRNLNPAVINPFNFIVHIGDIKDGWRPCDKSQYTDVAQIFTHPSNTLLYDPRDVFFLGESIKQCTE
jgi:hypothetical protein